MVKPQFVNTFCWSTKLIYLKANKLVDTKLNFIKFMLNIIYTHVLKPDLASQNISFVTKN